MALRTDFYNLMFTKQKTDQGFLKVPIRATRAGIFRYIKKDGSLVRELRPEIEVFSPMSLSTLATIPLTIGHPKDLVTVDNFKGLAVGMTGENVTQDGIFVDVAAVITDKKAVADLEKKIDAGESQEVSCGYTCDVVDAPGFWNGEPYDAIQTNIKYNHVALVDKGRAGPEVRIKLDGEDAVNENNSYKLGVDAMKKILITGVEFEIKADVADAVEALIANSAKEVEALKAEKDEIKKNLDSMEAKKDSLDAEVKTLSASLEEAKKEVKIDHAQIDALVEERASIVEVASIIIPTFKKDGKDNLAIKKEVIAQVSPDVKLDEKSEDYINARFDAIAEKKDSFVDQVKKALENNKNTNQEKKDSASARDAYIEETRNAWKKPLITR